MTRIWSLNSSLSYEKRWDATDQMLLINTEASGLDCLAYI
jgi:hypothetical protein